MTWQDIYDALNEALAESPTRAKLFWKKEGLCADGVPVAQITLSSGLILRTSTYKSKDYWPPQDLAPAIIEWWQKFETKAMHSANTKAVLTKHFGEQLAVPEEVKVLLAFCERDPLFRELLDRRKVLSST